jgi:hypothetical protein
MGLGQNPPPQFGQTLAKTVSTQSRQKVHSKEQIIALVALATKGVSQCSQQGRSSNMITPSITTL